MTEYVELHARSAFSFLHAASLPEDLAAAAAEAGHGVFGLADAGGVYGAPRFHTAARGAGLRPRRARPASWWRPRARSAPGRCMPSCSATSIRARSARTAAASTPRGREGCAWSPAAGSAMRRRS